MVSTEDGRMSYFRSGKTSLRRKYLNKDLKKIRQQVVWASGERMFQREEIAGIKAQRWE